MGTFEGHLLPGSAFVLFGLWHLTNVIRSYVSSPSTFHTRPWFPAGLPGRLKYMELILMAIGASLSISAEMVLAQPGHWMLDKDGNIPIHMMAQFEHASMALFFLLYALIALATEGFFNSRAKPLPFGFLHIIGACAFGQEFLLFLYHSGDHMGVEGQYHTLLRIPIGIILVSGLLELPFPRSFLPPLVRSACIMLQGLVLIQTAFSIWVPRFRALNCGPTPEHSLWCDGEEWVHRAKALANLQFNWWTALLVVFIVVLFVVLRAVHGKDEYKAMEESRFVEEEGAHPHYEHGDIEEAMSEDSEGLIKASRQSSGNLSHSDQEH